MNALATAPGVIATPGKYYIGAQEVMEYLDCKENKAYELIRQLRDELVKAGKLTPAYPIGKVPRKYFFERCSFSEDEELMGIMLEKEITFIPTVRELQDTALCQIGRMSRFWHISIIIIWLCRLYMIGKMAICAEHILGQHGNGQEVQRMPGAKSMRLTAP